ncbi:MAG TPA: hypothetical protein VK472_08565 [Allosphingosinicella sp.]|nr:hypothetical protein [Allosphingosinicella sp.]
MTRANLLGTTILAVLMLPGPAAAASPGSARSSKSKAEAARCDTGPNWAAVPREALDAPDLPMRVTNWVSVDADGSLSWNGSPIDSEQAQQYLELTGMMVPRPALVLNRLPGTPCDEIGKAADLIERTIACAPDLCFLTEGGKRPIPSPPAPPAPPRPPG